MKHLLWLLPNRTHGSRWTSRHRATPALAVLVIVSWLMLASNEESALLNLSLVYRGSDAGKKLAAPTNSTFQIDGDDIVEKPTHESSVQQQRQGQRQLLFHLVFTVDYFSTLNLRCIESIFYFHPTARIKLHSNVYYPIESTDSTTANMTSSRQRFASSIQALQDLGYSIEIVAFSAAEVLDRAVEMDQAMRTTSTLINATAARVWSSRLDQWKAQKYWYSNEANLLRLCLLYTEGGIYLDTDVILVRPLAAMEQSFVAQNADVNDGLILDNTMARDGKSFHNAVMKFLQAGNPFLAAAIDDFVQNYNGTVWGNNGPRVFRRTSTTHSSWICPDKVDSSSFPTAPAATTATHDKSNACWLQPLPAEAFQPVPWRRWVDYCFDRKTSPVGDEAVDLVRAPGVYAIHLNNHLIGDALEDERYIRDSVCDHVLHAFCVLPCRTS
jgi:Glycosyltransferase sugar-binding region containing DXD motif/Alpha 1,4-glycosyltransferase conserved region